MTAAPAAEDEPNPNPEPTGDDVLDDDEVGNEHAAAADIDDILHRREPSVHSEDADDPYTDVSSMSDVEGAGETLRRVHSLGSGGERRNSVGSNSSLDLNPEEVHLGHSGSTEKDGSGDGNGDDPRTNVMMQLSHSHSSGSMNRNASSSNVSGAGGNGNGK